MLKADVSDAGNGWSDNRIIEALETSPSMVYRARKQLVEEGFEAVLSRKPRATPAVARIFDGEKEAKLIALACSKPPRTSATAKCWELRAAMSMARLWRDQGKPQQARELLAPVYGGGSRRGLIHAI